MKTYVIVAIALIAVGVLGLVYTQFSYTTESEAARIGPLELTVTEKETVNIPTWLGIGAIVAGSAVFAYGAIKN